MECPPSPPPRLPEPKLRADWHGHEPVVSVLCATYQHAPFIMDALDGILGQRTTFPFEVIIRDDASTDGTVEAIRCIEAEYPNVVRTILEPVNTWGRIHFLEPLLKSASGEFIACCSGDDFWMNPAKLENQVRLLREDPSLVGTSHDMVPMRDGRISQGRRAPRRRISGRDLRRGTSVSIQTLLYRNWDDDGIPYLSRVVTEDYFLTARLGRRGDILHEPASGPTCYRIHDASLWSTKRHEVRAAERSTSFFWIGAYFADVGDAASARYYLRRSAEDVLNSHLGRSVDPRPTLWARLPWRMLRTMLGRVLRRIRGA